ncbi:mitochondrial import inner membrane translocase subunit Tim29-like [Vespa mandarinia]|uniref:mitochondrial import inner membrane translocase subunit Tim29-like n=1 Tax=Vespa mandarinia TaxID=7446 RepID=UPI001615F977|nr:mitochondrial import inner membrane translocase subunit Tim29-like [Vespa mandarinia]
MNFRSSIQLGEKVKLIFNPFYLKFNKVINTIKNNGMSERFKGTILEHWGNYWKNLYIDYKEVTIDTIKDCKSHPIRTSIYSTVLGSTYYLYKHNPDEDSFREHLLENAIKLMQVGETIRNEISVQHVEILEKYYNEGIVRRFSIGILSIIWLDNYDKECSLYKAVCPYLKPRYLNFYERIIDIGFLDRWWILDRKMIDYDINMKEFDVIC